MHLTEAKGILHGGNGQVGMNLYRGCTHGCIYCDSRSRCYQFSHPFEDVEVKANAPELLERALRAKRKRCMIGTGSMSDPYMPCEEELRLTRRCLELLWRYGFGAVVQTKSDRVLRDIDLWEQIQKSTRGVVQMTVTTYEEELCKKLEPGVCTSSRRFEVLQRLQERGIPTVVWLSPILPFLNDTKENVLSILRDCHQTGVKGIVCFGMGVTLREGSREYFYAALDRHFPGLKERYIRTYGNAYVVPSPRQEELMALLESFCQSHGMLYKPEDCFAFLEAFPDPYEQLSLF